MRQSRLEFVDGMKVILFETSDDRLCWGGTLLLSTWFLWFDVVKPWLDKPDTEVPTPPPATATVAEPEKSEGQTTIEPEPGEQPEQTHN